MTDIIQYMLGLLINDSTLASLLNTVVPIKTIYSGPVDIVKEAQSTLRFPLMTLTAVSESFRTVPQGARDSRVVIDVWSRNSELEIHKIYEKITSLLNFQQGNSNTSWIAWERGGGLASQYETDIRLWHWSWDVIVWSI